MDATATQISAVPAEFLERVVRYFDPQEVILFGSLACGEADADSDVDLLVILDDDTPEEKRTLRAGYEARRGCPGSADINPCRRSWFERKRHLVGSLAEIAAGEGVPVYVRSR